MSLVKFIKAALALGFITTARAIIPWRGEHPVEIVTCYVSIYRLTNGSYVVHTGPNEFATFPCLHGAEQHAAGYLYRMADAWACPMPARAKRSRETQ